jgi:hypothetical protein
LVGVRVVAMASSGAAALSERVQSAPLGDRKQTVAQIKAVGVVCHARSPVFRCC